MRASGHQEVQGEHGRGRGREEDDHARGEDAEDPQTREYSRPQGGVQEVRIVRVVTLRIGRGSCT